MIKWSGKTPKQIGELELNFSNLCGANCLFCSRHHGVGNVPLMESSTFQNLITQLKDVETTHPIQTSGNGEVFLNQNYLDYVRELRKTKPNNKIWVYNNFSLLNKNRADIIVNENLFDKMHVRIDSLHKHIFEKNSNLNFETVMRNLKYFLSINTKIPFTFLYNNVNIYYNRCKTVTGKRPARDYYTDEELSLITNEAKDVEDYFRPLVKSPVEFCVINPCLWGERHLAPKDLTTSCPKINVIKNVIWVLPNGDCTCCCYDDRQDTFIAGNINEEHILDIYHGERRKEWIRKIENFETRNYACCRNARCCGFGDGVEGK